jgi:hypothetical protein
MRNESCPTCGTHEPNSLRYSCGAGAVLGGLSGVALVITRIAGPASITIPATLFVGALVGLLAGVQARKIIEMRADEGNVHRLRREPFREEIRRDPYYEDFET